MVRSLYSGVSGLKSHQTRMDVIGNNIANVNTYGYKTHRTTFSDIYYQYQRTETGGRASSAGNNPSQVGYGVQVASIDKDMSMSNLQNTGRTFDCAISGDGFFICGTMDSQKNINHVTYTRLGNFGIDSRGNLVNALNQFILGTRNTDRLKGGKYSEDEILGIDPASSPQELDYLNINHLVWDAFKPECQVEMDNIPGKHKTLAIAEQSGLPVSIFAGDNPYDDRQDIAYDYHMRSGQALSTIAAAAAGGGGAAAADPLGEDLGAAAATVVTELTVGVGDEEQRFADDVKLKDAIDALKQAGETSNYSTDNIQVKSDYILYQVNGQYVNAQGVVYDEKVGLYTDKSGNYYTYNCDTSVDREGNITKTYSYTLMSEQVDATTGEGTGVYEPATPARTYTYNNNLETFEMESGGNMLYANMTDGSLKYKDLEDFNIDTTGILIAGYANELRSIGRIEVGVFDNPEGLKEIGDTQYAQSSASGVVTVKKPGDSGAGEIESSKLEMSNVNLADEFSDMIITQRGYQANARIITTSDSMLEELVNLKR